MIDSWAKEKDGFFRERDYIIGELKNLSFMFAMKIRIRRFLLPLSFALCLTAPNDTHAYLCKKLAPLAQKVPSYQKALKTTHWTKHLTNTSYSRSNVPITPNSFQKRFHQKRQSKIYDHVIIGKGMLGLSAASELLKKAPDMSLALVAPTSKDGKASEAAGFMIGCFGEVVDTTFSSSYGKTKFDLGYEATKKWDSWIEEIKNHPSFPKNLREEFTINKGTYVILNSVSGELDRLNFDTILDALDRYKEPHEMIITKDIPIRAKGYNPIPTHRSDLAVYIPEEGFMDPNIVLSGLENIVSSYPNVDIINDDVTQILTGDGSVQGISTQHTGDIMADAVILATGAFTQKLVDTIPELSGKIPRVLAGLGYAFSVDNDIDVEHVIRTPNRSGACGLHAVPRSKSELYIGASNNVRDVPAFAPTLDIANFVQRCAMEQINTSLAQSEIIESHVGNRPVSIDTLPLFGETETVKGLYFLTGTYRDGASQVPVLAKLFANHILHGDPILDNMFAPERDPIELYTKEELINEAVKHTLAGTYERHMVLPVPDWDKTCEEMYKLFFNNLYDRIEKEYGFVSLDLLLQCLLLKN